MDWDALQSSIPASPAGIIQMSWARSLFFVDFGWAGGAQVLAVCFARWSEMDLKEVHMQEMHSEELLIKYIPVNVNEAGNHLLLRLPNL